MIAGGGTDAGVFEDIADLLAQDYTVVTYDPRGNSRSPLDGPAVDQQIEVHSEDAKRLLETVASGPAAVFGTSSGAIVALDLIARHPSLVSRLVAHEPPLLELLPDAARWRAFHDDVYDTYRREGAMIAMQKWIAGVGLDATVPSEAELPPRVAEAMQRMAGNMELFLAHELLPFTRYVPDVARLSRHKDRIVLAVGNDTRNNLAGQLVYRPAALLAERFGTQISDFPGDHGGYGAHAAEFAVKLREVLK
ncbi:alpha/beta fold hydrolase [Ktedonosporobacter rubrisoli]|uniref:alpha/beta fold hydrolase n=1 Tax=Ktedonosporobacter rubrisoli TaxID=2509675 RepID=UPI001A922A42|nr:alpha/beta fold hydrolase [Ktedonosporobacter rubrisoli]